MKKIMKRHSGKVILAVLALVFVGSVVFSGQASSANNEGVVIKDHIKGNPDSSLVLAKHGDFECPACAAAYPVVDRILEEFGDQVRFEYKHLPLTSIHRLAEPAAVAAEAAGQQGKFFEYHDLLYDRQALWARSGNPSGMFIGYAEELGLDVDLFRQHQGASMLRDKVRSETRDALSRGYQSTPTFTINGQRIQYGGYEALRAQIIAALGHSSGEDSHEDIEFGI